MRISGFLDVGLGILKSRILRRMRIRARMLGIIWGGGIGFETWSVVKRLRKKDLMCEVRSLSSLMTLPDSFCNVFILPLFLLIWTHLWKNAVLQSPLTHQSYLLFEIHNNSSWSRIVDISSWRFSSKVQVEKRVWVVLEVKLSAFQSSNCPILPPIKVAENTPIPF